MVRIPRRKAKSNFRWLVCNVCFSWLFPLRLVKLIVLRFVLWTGTTRRPQDRKQQIERGISRLQFSCLKQGALNRAIIILLCFFGLGVFRSVEIMLNLDHTDCLSNIYILNLYLCLFISFQQLKKMRDVFDTDSPSPRSKKKARINS